jgi:hypothetical protein
MQQIFSLGILAKLFQIFKFLQGIWIDFAFSSVSCLNNGVSVILTSGLESVYSKTQAL